MLQLSNVCHIRAVGRERHGVHRLMTRQSHGTHLGPVGRHAGAGGHPSRASPVASTSRVRCSPGRIPPNKKYLDRQRLFRPVFLRDRGPEWRGPGRCDVVLAPSRYDHPSTRCSPSILPSLAARRLRVGVGRWDSRQDNGDDGRWILVGSTDFDPRRHRRLRLDAVVEDRKTAAEAEANVRGGHLPIARDLHPRSVRRTRSRRRAM